MTALGVVSTVHCHPLNLFTHNLRILFLSCSSFSSSSGCASFVPRCRHLSLSHSSPCPSHHRRVISIHNHYRHNHYSRCTASFPQLSSPPPHLLSSVLPSHSHLYLPSPLYLLSHFPPLSIILLLRVFSLSLFSLPHHFHRHAFLLLTPLLLAVFASADSFSLSRRRAAEESHQDILFPSHSQFHSGRCNYHPWPGLIKAPRPLLSLTSHRR